MRVRGARSCRVSSTRIRTGYGRYALPDGAQCWLCTGCTMGGKFVMLSGGLGTRLAEETEVRPKPMVEIGGQPILWHILKMFSAFGLNEFVVCLGYKGYMIKEYFGN